MRVTGLPQERVFSPNGDGYEDVWSQSWSLSEAATVSVLIVDGQGATVRSLLVDRPDDTTVSVSWNGLDDFGVLVPDGIYTARLTARDAQGDVASRRCGSGCAGGAGGVDVAGVGVDGVGHGRSGGHPATGRGC